MTRKMKAILVLFFAAEIVNSAKVGVLKGRIADLETQRDIYASRAQNWLDRAVEDEEVIDSLQIRLDETADRKIELTEAGTFFCTAYCTEQYEHICGPKQDRHLLCRKPSDSSRRSSRDLRASEK